MKLKFFYLYSRFFLLKVLKFVFKIKVEEKIFYVYFSDNILLNIFLILLCGKYENNFFLGGLKYKYYVFYIKRFKKMWVYVSISIINFSKWIDYKVWF